MPVDLPLYIDSTMRSCFVSCPQKFLREFAQGYRPATKSVDLHAGACFATALETTYRGIWELNLPFEQSIERARAAFDVAWGDFEIPEFKRTAKTRERVWDAIVGGSGDKDEGYFQRYAPKTDHVQPYFAADGKPTFEYTFAIPLEPTAPNDQLFSNEAILEHRWFPLHPSGQPFTYVGRFDALGSYQNRPVVRDEKTTGGSISTNWSDQWDLRAQFLGYSWACQQAGIDLDTVVVRGIAIQKTQILHAEAIKPFSKHLVAKWHEQLRRDLWRIRRAWDEQYFDYDLDKSCTSYGGCVFLPVCQSPNPES